jgi:hypothetical protein
MQRQKAESDKSCINSCEGTRNKKQKARERERDTHTHTGREEETGDKSYL